MCIYLVKMRRKCRFGRAIRLLTDLIKLNVINSRDIALMELVNDLHSVKVSMAYISLISDFLPAFANIDMKELYNSNLACVSRGKNTHTHTHAYMNPRMYARTYTCTHAHT